MTGPAANPSPLARLALMALGAPAPMTGVPAAAIRPRLPARFEGEGDGAPPPEESGPPWSPRLATAEGAGSEARPAGPPAMLSPAVVSRSGPLAAPPGALPSPMAMGPAVAAGPTDPMSPAAPAGPRPRPDVSAPTRGEGAPPAPLLPPATIPAPPWSSPMPAAPSVPRAGPARSPAPAAAPPPPDIVIHIGRIEVAAAPAPPRATPPAPPRPVSGLGDYLRGREGRR